MKPGLHIISNVFDSGCNGVVGHERGVYDDVEVFNLEVSLIQGFEGASIIDVVIKGYGEVRVCDGSDKCRVVSRRRRQAEAMAVDKDVDGQDVLRPVLLWR